LSQRNALLLKGHKFDRVTQRLIVDGTNGFAKAFEMFVSGHDELDAEFEFEVHKYAMALLQTRYLEACHAHLKAWKQKKKNVDPARLVCLLKRPQLQQLVSEPASRAFAIAKYRSRKLRADVIWFCLPPKHRWKAQLMGNKELTACLYLFTPDVLHRNVDDQKKIMKAFKAAIPTSAGPQKITSQQVLACNFLKDRFKDSSAIWSVPRIIFDAMTLSGSDIPPCTLGLVDFAVACLHEGCVPESALVPMDDRSLVFFRILCARPEDRKVVRPQFETYSKSHVSVIVLSCTSMSDGIRVDWKLDRHCDIDLRHVATPSGLSQVVLWRHSAIFTRLALLPHTRDSVLIASQALPLENRIHHEDGREITEPLAIVQYDTLDSMRLLEYFCSMPSLGAVDDGFLPQFRVALESNCYSRALVDILITEGVLDHKLDEFGESLLKLNFANVTWDLSAALAAPVQAISSCCTQDRYNTYENSLGDAWESRLWHILR
jgi:hypothetical protein